MHYWRLNRDGESKLANTNLYIDDPSDPSFEVFVALSAIVLLRDTLDQAAAKRMYKLFMDENWGPQHITSCYRKICKQISGAPDIVKLTDGENWFVNHVITTWYLGIYYHEQHIPVRVSYETALMFRPIDDWLPVPFIAGVGFGNWQTPPKEKL